jgi:hypothetical protein
VGLPPTFPGLESKQKEPIMDREKLIDRNKVFHHEGGITYFTKKTERTLFFILTLAMLFWGLLDMAGL